MFSRKLSGGSFVAVFLLTWAILMSTVAQAASPLAPHKHMFKGPDGVLLVADIYAPADKAKHPVVILLHMVGGSKEDYQPLIQPLLAQGFIIANLDMRGHGLSVRNASGAPVQYKQFKDEDWAKLQFDAITVVQNIVTVPGVDASKIAMVGASIGANAAIMAANGNVNIKSVILLSPGLDFHKLKPSEAMSKVHRPVLIIAAKDDQYSADSGAKLVQLTPATSRFQLLPSGGHGTEMLRSHPELNTQIPAWLKKAMP